MTPQKVLTALDPQNIEKAAVILKQGGLVAFPTETVYGLGADAFNAKAVCRIFEAKKRPSFDPLIVHVSSPEEAYKLWLETPKVAKDLIKAFWPGPLTLVLPKSSLVPEVVTSGLPTVAVRMPKNETALSLIRALGHPIAAPSANLFGYTSPTLASHVWEDLGENVDLVLDGGESSVGVESTVVKISPDGCTLLRPGAVTQEEMEKITRFKKVSEKPEVLESPGQLDAHYAPWTPLYFMEKPWGDRSKDVEAMLKTMEEKKQSPLRAGLLSFSSVPKSPLFESVQVLSEKGDLVEAASNLFQAIRKLDKMNLDILFAEPVPEKGIGIAIMDRLRKASGGKYVEKHVLS